LLLLLDYLYRLLFIKIDFLNFRIPTKCQAIIVNTKLARAARAVMNFEKCDVNNNSSEITVTTEAVDEAVQTLLKYRQQIDSNKVPRIDSPIKKDCDECADIRKNFVRIVGKNNFDKMLADTYEVDNNSSLEAKQLFNLLKKVKLFFNDFILFIFIFYSITERTI
jgi:hypothetical protein